MEDNKQRYEIDAELLSEFIDDRLYLAAVLDTVEFTEEQLKIIDELYEEYYMQFSASQEEGYDDSGNAA